jgi:hypothetical protein
LSDRSHWYAVFGGPIVFGLFEVIFLVLAFMADLGTWGIGAFASRERVTSYYRDR